MDMSLEHHTHEHGLGKNSKWRVKKIVTSFLTIKGKVLILKRSRRVGSYKRKWSGVSGYLEESDSSPLERARQELLEEVGLTSDKLRFVRQGDPLITPDRKFKIFWVVNPFLFEAFSNKIRLDWENEEYRLVRPGELEKYNSVPGLIDALQRVLPTESRYVVPIETSRLINRIIEDKVHGAHFLSLGALRALRHCLWEIRSSDPMVIFNELREVGFKLAYARPSMTPIFNSVCSALYYIQAAIARNSSKQLVRSTLIQKMQEIENTLATRFKKTVQNTAKLVKSDYTILTHSFSLTVFEALREAFQTRRKFGVIVTESRPLFEGRRLATALSELGVKITLVTDSAVGRVCGEADLVLVGADSVLYNGSVVNKVGTYLISLSAEENKKPFYIACEKNKFNVKHYLLGKLDLEEKSPSEVWNVSNSQIEVRNPYFDLTPAHAISKIITEDGHIDPIDVSLVIEKMATKLAYP